MNKDLEQLLREFEQGLTKGKYDSYMPILRNSFIPYLEKERYKDIEESVDRFFEMLVSPNDIIYGGVYYIDSTPKVTNESAIDKYLTSVSEFFKSVIFPKWPKCPLSTAENFKGYYNDILTRSNKKLKKHESRIHLDEDSITNLLECLYELNDVSFKNIMLKAVIPLILLYGFKIGTIAELKRENFDNVMRVIKIKLEDDIVNLELPYNVFLYVNEIYQKNVGEIYLFDTAKDQRLVSDYFDDFLVKYNKKINAKSKITLDGLAKFAVINMFYVGMNPIVIGQISGMKDINLNYCQRQAWEKNKIQLNGYVNSKIRGIDIYDGFGLYRADNKG